MTAEEGQFRKGEQILDASLSEIRSSPDFASTAARELPGSRSYHYKNQFLSWNFEFVRDSLVDFETHRTKVLLEYMEPSARLGKEDIISISVSSEVFRPAQISGFKKQIRYEVRLEDVRQKGLADILNDSFAQGEALQAP